MFPLLLLPFLSPSKIICQEISRTNVKPLVHPHDSEHLFINYSASFTGKIDETSDVRFRSTNGHNLPIKDNLVETDICLNYNALWVEIDGVPSPFFTFYPFDEEVLRESISARTCRKDDGDGVLFELEDFRKETLLHDTCLSYVQFRSIYESNQSFGPQIQNEGVVVEVLDPYFRIYARMKPVAPTITLVKSDLKKCLVSEQLQQGQDRVSNAATTGVVIGAIVFICLVVGVFFFKRKKKTTNTEMDQNPEYGQQEYYYQDEQKRTNLVENNEEYDGGAYATDQECYIKDSNIEYYDYSICQDRQDT